MLTGGGAAVTAEVIDDDAGLAQRAAELRAGAPDVGPDGSRFLDLACDGGCGTTARLDFDDPVRPSGWAERPDGDFCPGCAAR